MNKSALTNLIAVAIIGLGLFFENNLLLMVGLFALSGAFTNWLAIHMLFEKVPRLYGSGVIPNRFEEFKTAIHQLMMTQFFSQQQIDDFVSAQATTSLHLTPVIEQVDLTPAYDKLVETIMQSSFGSMLGMFGGADALTPLKEPFVNNLKLSLIEITEDDHFHQLIQERVDRPDTMQEIQQKIDNIIQQRLDELTPQIVKSMVQQLIQNHLGWLGGLGRFVWWSNRLDFGGISLRNS